MFVYRGLHEELMAIRDLSVSIPQHTHRCGTHLVILVPESQFEDRRIDLILSPSNPETLQDIATVVGILLVEPPDPLLDGGNNLVGWMAAQFAARAISETVFVLLQIFEQLLNRRACHLGRFHQRTRRISNSVNTTVIVIAIRIAGAVLHVTDERIVPIDQIQRSIRGEF